MVSAGGVAAASTQSREEGAPSVSKPAWTWTVEERLDRRFDPGDSNKRREGKAGGAGANLVDGAKDPQLLLPHEVFDHLLTRAFFSRPEEAAQAREEIAGAARLRGLGEGFLDDLGRLAADYLRVRSAQKAYPNVYATAPDPEKGEVLQEMDRAWYAVCRTRNAALQAARSLYGEESFHRFLYEAVAPSMTVRVAEVSTVRDRLRFEAQGCPKPASLADGEGKDLGKPAWEWTVAERLDKLFDPVESRRRSEAHAYKMRRGGPQGGPATILVDGSSNPELVLPHQLFERLIRQLYFSEPEALEAARKKILPEARRHGLGEDLMESLPDVAPGYFAYKRRAKERFDRYAQGSPAEKRALEQEEKEVGLAMCAARKQGLEAARSYFGREKLDRFLYEVIAPEMSLSYPDGAWKEQLLFIEGGCS